MAGSYGTEHQRDARDGDATTNHGSTFRYRPRRYKAPVASMGARLGAGLAPGELWSRRPVRPRSGAPRRVRSYAGEVPLPPGPSSPPLFQIARWVARPLELLDDCQRTYGDVFTMRAPRAGAFVIVSVPELIKEVFAAPPDVLLAGMGNAMLLEPMVGKNSVLTLDGAEHLRQRRLLLPAFNGERMQAFGTVMREIAEASFERWPIGEPFSLHTHLQDITLDVILRTVFGLDAGDAHGALRTKIVELLDRAARPWMMLPGMLGVDLLRIPFLPVSKLKRAVDEALYAVIAERRRRPSGGTDVLSTMLLARDEQGQPMTDVELRDELVTLLIAGHETTATSLGWVFDRLLAHPQTYAKLATEIDAGRDEYLDAVIRETLRVRPILPLVGRHVVKPFTLGPWTIPPGARIAPSIYLAGRREDAYPHPDRFEPERWLGVRPDPYSWLPFGGGTRRCLGMAFAQFEMRIVLQTVVPRARLQLAQGPARVVRRGITLAPEGGPRVVLVARASSNAAQLTSR
ncbi:MAG: cytochrome P450, partial [Deltaproteobacteria bacterium]|nr:cytochrome P450 [Deltaproteobacteria bacterium]